MAIGFFRPRVFSFGLDLAFSCSHTRIRPRSFLPCVVSVTAIENFDFAFAFGPRELVLTRVARECVLVLAPVRFPSPGGEITSTRIVPGSWPFVLDFSGF